MRAVLSATHCSPLLLPHTNHHLLLVFSCRIYIYDVFMWKFITGSSPVGGSFPSLGNAAHIPSLSKALNPLQGHVWVSVRQDLQLHGVADQYMPSKWRIKTNRLCVQVYKGWTIPILVVLFSSLAVPLVLDLFQNMKGGGGPSRLALFQ